MGEHFEENFWIPRSHPLSVDKHFDADVNDVAKKTHTSSIGTGHLRALRHRLWLKRGNPNVKDGSWRPLQLRRTGAERWLDDLDGKIQVSTVHDGVKFFTRGDGVLVGRLAMGP